jgi:hypothetical protein
MPGPLRIEYEGTLYLTSLAGFALVKREVSGNLDLTLEDVRL